MKVLSVNSGSSSLKFGLFEVKDGDTRSLLHGEVEGIGSRSRSWIRNAQDRVVREDHNKVVNQEEAFRGFSRMYKQESLPWPDVVGHRVVHGGPKLRVHQLITPTVLQDLDAAAIFAPLHVPNALRLIKMAESEFADVPQVACFDTAFHRTIPEHAARFALPGKFWDAGIQRYGFHGLSCESILHYLGERIPARMIVAHLGSGSSLTAIANGASIDTTMGLTPTGGIVMATRTGDLDPGVFLHILRTGGSDADELEKLVDMRSGMLGISGQTGDMRELRAKVNDSAAQMAMDVFCYSIKKAIGAFAAVLGGLDMLVFAGGIGEHDAETRAQVCAGMDVLGIAIDEDSNRASASKISRKDSKAEVCVVPSDEDAQIARISWRLIESLGK